MTSDKGGPRGRVCAVYLFRVADITDEIVIFYYPLKHFCTTTRNAIILSTSQRYEGIILVGTSKLIALKIKELK